MSSFAELRRTIRADLDAQIRFKVQPAEGVSSTLDVLALPGTWATVMFRLAAACHRSRLRPLSRLLYFLNVVVTGADLAPGATVGPGLVIAHPVGMGWGKNFTCGRDVVMTGMCRFGSSAAGNGARLGEPTVGDEVILLDGAKLIGPITIGNRAVIAANALVLHDVRPGALVVGQPARHVATRPDRRGDLTPLAAAHTLIASLAEPPSAGDQEGRDTA
jgi:serine O-acetyltransferase